MDVRPRVPASCPDADRAARDAAGDAFAIRFIVPEGVTVFDDLVHGRIEFDHANIEDFVILRSDGYPTYHLSVVVDDVEMEMTHVVRGDDHISNTPKQVLLYEAMSAPVPQFAHVPLILGPDKKRLSKRHGATSVGEYEKQGYLPEAMVNFLALLGWSPGNDEEVFTRDELIERFSLEGISGGNAVFNPEKLDWFNQQHIMRMPARRSSNALGRIWRPPACLARHSPIPGTRREAIDLVKPRARKLHDIVPQLVPFLRDDVRAGCGGGGEASVRAGSGPAPGRVARRSWRTSTPFDPPTLEAALRALADERGIKAGVLIHATRVAVTGQAVSPGIFEVLALVGRDRALRRLCVRWRLTTIARALTEAEYARARRVLMRRDPRLAR